MLTTSSAIVQGSSPRRSELIQRDADIAVLKRARKQIIDVRVMLDIYSHDLSYELAAPARKVDEALAWLLLRRELESEA